MPSRYARRMEKVAVALTLAIYASLLVALIPRHEPWADEAQAWELASSLSLRHLFGTYIHYEATPGLWHALLWLLSRAQVTYSGLHWIVGIFAFASMAVLTAAAPFPLLMRLPLPFTYFFVFQYAVVARSYVLFPLLLFGLACYWRRRFERLIPVAFLIGLLGNVSAHGFAVAIGLTIVLSLEWLRLSPVNRPQRQRLLPAALILIVMLSFAAWCMVPTPDTGWVFVARQMVAAPSTAAEAVRPSASRHLISLLAGTAQAEANGLSLAFGHGLATKFKLGLLIWGLLGWIWLREGKLRYLLPVLLLALLWRPVFSHFYHAGLVWVFFLFVWWVTWPERNAVSPAAWQRISLMAVVAVSIAIQLAWGFEAVRYEIAMRYSPDREGATILRRYLERGDKVVVAIPSRQQGTAISQYFVTGLQPYFTTQPISNMPFRFWFWGGDDALREMYLSASADRSAVVVVEETSWDPRYETEERRLTTLGYRRMESACGQIFYPTMKNPPQCHAFYAPPERH